MSVAVVTGASRGIGRAIAVEAARRGYDVVVAYRSQADEAAAVVQEIADLGRDAVAVGCDLADLSSVHVIAEVAQELGGVKLLVNNAGLARARSLDELTLDDWHAAVTTNLTAPGWLSQLLAADLRRERGAIINISSTAALAGSLHSLAYGATKAGVLGLTRTLALMLAPEVRVNALCPGPIETDIMAAMAPDRRAAVLAATPAGRLGTPREVAEAVLDISQWKYCTGQAIVLDGGRVMH